RDRGLHPPAAQEDRAGPDPHRHRARPRLLPRKDPGLNQERRLPAGPGDPAMLRAPMQAAQPQREQRSLFGEILDWMLAPLLLLWPMSIALTWLVAQSIANRPYDRELGQLAHGVARQVPPLTEPISADQQGELKRQLERSAALLLRPDDSDSVYFQVLGPRGELI